MPRHIIHPNLKGQVFGHWHVIDFYDIQNFSEWRYVCECDCPNHTRKIVYERNLLKNKSTKCGKKGCFNPSPKNKKGFNPYVTEGIITKIFYGKEMCIIDTEDLEKVSLHSWRTSHDKNNDTRWSTVIDGKTQTISRFILDFPENKIVDHINGNTNDNRKSNLRIVTNQNNLFNTKAPITNSSGTKGVSFNKRTKKYSSYITINKKVIRFPETKILEEAQYMRYIAETLLFKDFSIYLSRNIPAPEKPKNYKKLEDLVAKKIERTIN